jgi:phosphatidylglycerol:prolipoprotein diacylglycerol transferase
VEWAAKRLGLNANDTYGVASVGVFAGIFFSRLTFVALHWSAYQENLLSIIWPLTSGYELWGGLVGGIAGIFFYGRAKQLPVGKTLDALIIGILIILMFASLSDFLAGPGYGESTNLFWGINQFGLRRHPVQIYEILGGSFALAAWWLLLPKHEFAGQLFLTATAIYSAVRLFTDAYRANAWLVLDGYHGIQLVTFLITLTSLILLARFSLQIANPKSEI